MRGDLIVPVLSGTCLIAASGTGGEIPGPNGGFQKQGSPLDTPHNTALFTSAQKEGTPDIWKLPHCNDMLAGPRP